jgi:tetratricopeptide (TPR) repeat protein
MFAAGPAMAAKKAAAPSPSPTVAPTPTPEPLDVQIPRLQAKIKADPNDHDSMQALAGDYLQVSRPDLALQLTQGLMQNGSKTAYVYYLDGFALAQLGHPKEAMADLEQASNLDPTNAAVLTLLTNLYLQSGRVDDADRIAKRATTFNANDANVWTNYGIVLAAEKKYDEARLQLEKAAQLQPNNAGPVIYEARTYVDQGSIPLALSLYDRAITIDPSNGDTWLGKAQLQGAQHDVKGAIETYETLLGRVTDTTSKAAIIDMEARLYGTEKMDDQAQTQYKRAIDQYPNIADTHIAYGDYLAFIKQMPLAQAQWTAALGPNNDNVTALERLGELYAQNKDYPKSISQFERITQLNPNDADANMALGQIYMANKQADKSHDAFRHAYDLTHAPAALIGVGEADYELKNYKEASEIFDSVDKGAPDWIQQNPGVLVLFGKAYTANNESGKAKAAFTKFLNFVKPDSDAAKEVNKLLADLNKPGAPKPAPKASSEPSSH